LGAIVSDIHFQLYLYFVAFVYCVVTMIILTTKEKPDTKLVVAMLIGVPFVPIAMVLSIPVGIYSTISKSWETLLRRERLRVKR
jgi:hypothetical protein